MKRHILLTLILLIGFASAATAQEPRAGKEIRYVTKSGKYNNSGTSWTDAKNNVQDAINDLVNKGLTGEVWVARGTYTPTESTEASGGSTLYMSFKVPAGITVRGGFYGPGEVPTRVDSLHYFRQLMGDTYMEVLAADDVAVADTNAINAGDWFPGEDRADQRALYQSNVKGVSADKTYPYLSILSGDLSLPAKFEWNSTKKYWNAQFYGNSFHVVWFATEGFDKTTGRANPLNTGLGEAVVEGFTIMNGNARNSDLNSRPHNAYGGGVYMVQGSRLENCTVQQCEASRDGGGIYMDGGGVVSHCYISNCQALGIGSRNGYGGGVCLETNKNVTNTRMGMYRSVINGCVARLGGGVAINTENTTGPNGKDLRDLAFLSASAIYNNTSTHEAGGLYMNGGGAISNITITRNQCNGTGIISNGMVQGRAGGLYCRDHATVFNCVLWGNECKANNDLQYASSQSSVNNDLTVDMRYCAVAFADYTDWSSTSKEGIFSISNYNTKTDAGANASETDQYPHFNHPSPKAGYIDIIPAGSTQTQTQQGLRRFYDWQPGVNSCLANAGIVALDLNTEGNLPFSALYKDVLGNDYNPRATLGGYTRKFGTMTAQKVGDDYHFYVDPAFSTARELTEDKQGDSWEHPARFLSNVLYSIYNDKSLEGGGNRYAGNTVYIHVKEGTVNNTNSYVYDKRVREMTIGVRSDNLVILGGYPSELTGTDKKATIDSITYERNPLRYPTFISGVITGENDYEMNAAHLMQFDNCENVLFDGFQIRYANASSSIFDNSGNDGGAIRLINGARGITFRNLIIAGNTADRGAAVFAEDGTSATFENVIIHNNESKKVGKSSNRQGIIHALGNAELTFNHCNILNNVGYPAYLDGTDESHHPRLKFYNSIFFANGKEKISDAYGTQAVENALPSFAGSHTEGASAYVCLFDDASKSFEAQFDASNKFNLSYTLNGENFPRFINGVHNVGVSIGGDETFYGRSTSFEPHNENPMVNAAKSSLSEFGNALVWNAANTDMSARITRNYGGLPDIGAIENHAASVEDEGENANSGGQEAVGDVIYVKPAKAGGSDTKNGGTSWDDALETVQKAIEMADVRGKINVSPGAEALITFEEMKDKWLLLKSNRENTNSYWILGGNKIIWVDQPFSGSSIDKKTKLCFKFVPKDASDTRDGDFYIKTYGTNGTDGYYITGDVRENVTMTVSAKGDDGAAYANRQLFRLEANTYNNGKGFYIENTTSSSSDKNYPNRYGNGLLAGWNNNNDSGSSWTIFEAQIPQAETTIRNKQVWVAEGTYMLRSDEDGHVLKNTNIDGSGAGRIWKQKYSILLRDGVNVYGGFPLKGYPGFGDRNPRKYETIVSPGDPTESLKPEEIENFKNQGLYIEAFDEEGKSYNTHDYPLQCRANSDICGSFGRVVVQEREFSNETVFDGFTIRDGFLNTTSQIQIAGKLYNIMSESDNQIGLAGGAGVYLLKNGVLENCVVKGNMTYTNPELTDGTAEKAEEGNKTFIAVNDNEDGGFHTVAAGVYNNGGTIKNSIISHNMILLELAKENDGYTNDDNRRPKAGWIYGAGLFQESGTTYNTIIHDNIGKFSNFKGTGEKFVKGYDDPYSDLGKANNEFWPSSKTTGQGGGQNCHQAVAGAGVFLVSGNFYNNTVAKNSYRLYPTYRKPNTMVGIGGLYAYKDAKLYNCIITDNEPLSVEEAGLKHPYEDSFLRSSSPSITILNHPIICFQVGTNAGNYTPNADGIEVKYSAINYKSANEIWNDVTIPGGISNLCLTNDSHTEKEAVNAFYFSSQNSYGYADRGEECNNTNTGYKDKSGTNWYGPLGETATSKLLTDDYHLSGTSPAVNNGINNIPEAMLPSYDAGYGTRIMDCTVDMGAYEWADSYTITPRVIYETDEQGNDIVDADGNKVVDETKAATFYVTPEGRGLASGDSPSNAACASKLQRVLDAAGRYKFQHPNQQIIVKVAQKANLKPEDTPFNYYATRTTDGENADVRIWSIIVPRGVEVWGGYSDYYEDDTDNGFYTLVNDVVTDHRDITGNPTYFNSTYYSSDLASNITTYHVVTFTDKLYDGSGLPYMMGDKIGEPSSYGKTAPAGGESAQSGAAAASLSTYMLMSDAYSHNTTWGNVTDRAVLDGIFITGGQADLQSVSSGSNTVNINRYGGAAIVTDYAHVRNCIVRKNSGIFGGALALTHNALVSGCLIDQNTANYGGAIYVFEHGTTLSDGTVVDTENTNYIPESDRYEHRYDTEMPHVYSTTIVNNEAKNQGGGVWYCPDHANVRFNSTLVWANACPDQPNVSGIYNITRPDGQTYVTTEFYPFNYCAVQDIRPSGLDNLSVGEQNKRGVRFHDEKNDPDGANRDQIAAEYVGMSGFGKYENFGYYGLTNYSVLNRAGMPLSEWNNLNESRKLALSAVDFKGENRFGYDAEKSTPRSNIEIGARAFDKYFPSQELMLRLFVAHPKDVDIDATYTLIDAGTSATGDDETSKLMRYYAQEGSSFAHPMTRLQDALDYIYKMRGFQVNSSDVDSVILNEFHANNMPFEIYMGPGTFYPTADPTGNNKNAVGNTFVVPEGVSIIGGHNPSYAVDKDGTPQNNTETEKHFLGRHRLPNYREPASADWNYNYYYVDANTKTPTDIEPYIVHNNGITYYIHHVDKDICGASRELSDINSNSIVEPWELKNQTILSGQMEGVENKGVNHIVTIHADQTYVGALPHTQGPALTDEEEHFEPYERGQIIAFDGLTFTGGYAHDYQALTVDNEHKIKYCYGGAILIDTNQYWNQYNKEWGDNGVTDDNTSRVYKRSSIPASAGYREIPLMISRCKFENNIAGLGGAISANTTLDVVNSSFEHNMAVNGKDLVDYEVTRSNGRKETVKFEVSYPGMGGAIYSTYQVSAINTLFANNEARNTDMTDISGNKYSVFTTSISAIEANKDITDEALEDESRKHTILGGSGGAIAVSTGGHFHVLNCNFVRNQANAYPAIYTLNPNNNNNNPNDPTLETSLKYYNQALNTVFWGNAISEEAKMRYAAVRPEALFAVDKIVNYGRADRGLDETYTGALREGELTPYNLDDLNDETKFSEQVWFSAYEAGKGKTPSNNQDLRDMDLHPKRPINAIINEALEARAKGSAYAYQNCNVELASENAVNEGPNFMNPSIEPGYEGYLESADWSPARLNSLTDAGWGKIKQKIVVDESTSTYEARFVRYGDTYTEDGVEKEYTVPENRKSYSGESDATYTEDGDLLTLGDYVTNGAYTTMRYLKGNEKYNKTVPLGEQEYMYATHEHQADKPVNFYRISYDPNPSHNQTYIDIGVYEYCHTQLSYDKEGEEGDEVDIIWVSPQEKPDNGLPDGSDWSRPTSDLQRAIETLLASRNGHRKEIRLMDGTFTPVYVIDGKFLSFYVNTGYLNTSVTEKEVGKGTMSLTIKGGYSYDLNGVRDVEEYPAIIRQQVRTDDGTSERWNHLFLIEDPTQRYGEDQYNEGNDFGHWTTSDSAGIIKTFPIQFDGVTLINDNAKAGTQGAVIHYSDLVKEEGSVIAGDADGEVKPTPVNVTTNPENAAVHTHDVVYNPAKLIISKSKIIGSGTHSGATDRSTSSAVYIGKNGGHALLYNNVLHTNYGNPLVAKCEAHTVNNTFALNGGFVDLGNDNAGNKEAEAAGSYIYNSVLWRNNYDKDSKTYGPQFGLNDFDYSETTTVGTSTFVEAGQTDNFKFNAFTGGDTLSIGYDVAGSVIETNKNNVGLIDTNEDMLYSPHFTDPNNEDIEKRDFSLQASLRLLQRGSDALYDTLKVDAASQIVRKSSFYNVYDLAYEPSFQEDAGSKPRLVSTIDVGAYEYQNVLNRVFYVDPTQGESGTQDGLSWEAGKVFGHGKLQNAVNLAALYRYVHDEEGYVFVKGGNTSSIDLHTNEDLVLRDGVCLIGGINPGFWEECKPTLTGDKELVYTNAALAEYIDSIYNNNEGYIGPNTHKVIVKSIKTDPHAAYNTDSGDAIFTLVDGFYVSATIDGVNDGGSITEPVISVTPQSPDAKVILRDIVVYDNDASAAPGVNIANIKNALVFGSLFRDNKTHDNETPADFTDDPAVLHLDDGAWGASLTVEGKTTTLPTGKTGIISPYNGHGMDDRDLGLTGTGKLDAQTARRDAEKTNRIVNSIVNYDGQDAELASRTDTLVTAQTKYTLSGHNYRRSDHNMYYQLTEGSKHINEIPIKSGEQGNEFLPERWRRFVNYGNGRDMLGNRRLLTLRNLTDAEKTADIEELLDRGAFETWRVEKDTRTTTEGHFTPHSGSVVYLMEGVNFVCGTDLMPGFLLLKKGASLYGNGHKVQSSFISVERTINPGGNVVSLPFRMDYSAGQSFSDGVGIPTYADAPEEDRTRPLGALSLTPDPGAKVYKYMGDLRSEWNHEFQNDNADAWEELLPDAKTGAILVPANQGVFFEPSGIEEPTLYAFTAMDSLWNKNVYEEDPAEDYKEIELVQYDDRESASTDNSGNTGADFTSQENMGWNCIGLPYLVSNYQTHNKNYAALAGASVDYNMHLPHTLWLYYDGLLATDGTAVDGDGGFYSVPSWEFTETKTDGVVTANNWHLPAGEQARIWWGEGFFVQTAAVSARENLRFYRPDATGIAVAAAPSAKLRNVRHYADEQLREELTDGLDIRLYNRTVRIRGLAGGEHIAIYDLSGRNYANASAGGATEWSGTLPSYGVFIICVDNVRRKVVVK